MLQTNLPPAREPVLPAALSLPTDYLEPKWYVAHTCSRHEKRVALQLQQRSIEVFLPLYQAVHRWKNGPTVVQLPLFPGHVFVRIPLKDRLGVLELPSVARLAGFNGHPVPLPEEDIQAIRNCLAVGQRIEPYPYLRVGRRVRVVGGPLCGLTGIVVRRKNTRLVISLELIMRSVAVEVDSFLLAPVD